MVKEIGFCEDFTLPDAGMHLDHADYEVDSSVLFIEKISHSRFRNPGVL
jgi:hypothetical protein